MSAKDGQPSEAESQSNYEAAVLDFLDREMAVAQPMMSEKKQSDELDALVADLLHQVITETDQPQVSGEMTVSPEAMKDLLAEFMPQQETDLLGESAGMPVEPNSEPEPVQAASTKAGASISVPEEVGSAVSELPAEPAPEANVAPARVASMFASRDTSKSRMPVIAAAVVCTLVVASFAIYHFSGSSGKTPQPDTVQTVMPGAVESKAANPAARPSSQPAAKPGTSPVVPPVAEKKAEPANAKAQGSAPQKPPVLQMTAPPVGPAANPQPAKEEKPPETQIAQAPPPAMPRVLPERAAPPVMNENPAPAAAIPEIKPVPQSPVVTAGADHDSPALQPSAPKPLVLTAVPVAARSLVPAVAISQVSPKFPEFALRTRMSGTVVLELEVDKQGKVLKATPVSGPQMFHREAINAAMQWRYRPASIGGTNVPSQVKVTFNFNLKP